MVNGKCHHVYDHLVRLQFKTFSKILGTQIMTLTAIKYITVTYVYL